MTFADHNHKDAARSLWVALQAQQLMSQFIAMKFMEHPKLSLYSIDHFFHHCVLRKAVETITAKVVKFENNLRSITALQKKIKGPSKVVTVLN